MNIRYPNEGMPKMPEFKAGPWIFPVILLLIAFTFAGSLFYEVGPDEVGVVQRFGRYVRTANPGLHMKLPVGIEMVQNIKVTHVFKEEFGFRTVAAGVRTLYMGREDEQDLSSRQAGRFSGNHSFLEESQMLTGDLNVAIVEWIVQYTVKDPVAFAFRVRDPRETIRNMSEAMMRLVIGDHTINQVLTSGRETIQSEVAKKLQEVLDSYGSGIDIRNVILQDVTPPDPVKPSFNEVNEARQEKEKMINQAWEEYNRIIPKAKGQAEQKIREAEGYLLERINRAKGDAERFELTLKAYQKAPEVTRRRLYLETMQHLYPQFRDKVVMDEAGKNVLPLLKLNPLSTEGNEGEKP